jgi:iron complex transport system ATP-binding protein
MKNGKLACRGTPGEIITREMLRDVFSIDSRVIEDEDNNCPYFIPIRGLPGQGENNGLH